MERAIAFARDYWTDTMRALGFLSRLRVRDRWFEGHNGRYERTARAFPLAAVLATAPAALALASLAAIGTPPLLAGAIATALGLLVTGALHEDGLADTFDGLGVRDPRKRLGAMRDSATGVFGLCALVCALLIRVACLAALAVFPIGAIVAWLFAAAGGRAAMVYLWNRTPAADESGAAVGAGQPNEGAVRMAIVSAALFAVPALLYGPLALAVGIIAVFAVIRTVRTRVAEPIGGHSGDVLGATAVLGELALLSPLAVVA